MRGAARCVTGPVSGCTLPASHFASARAAAFRGHLATRLFRGTCDVLSHCRARRHCCARTRPAREAPARHSMPFGAFCPLIAASLCKFGSTATPPAARDALGIVAATAQTHVPFRPARIEPASALRLPQPFLPPPATSDSGVPPAHSRRRSPGTPERFRVDRDGFPGARGNCVTGRPSRNSETRPAAAAARPKPAMRQPDIAGLRGKGLCDSRRGVA